MTYENVTIRVNRAPLTHYEKQILSAVHGLPEVSHITISDAHPRPAPTRADSIRINHVEPYRVLAASYGPKGEVRSWLLRGRNARAIAARIESIITVDRARGFFPERMAEGFQRLTKRIGRIESQLRDLSSAQAIAAEHIARIDTSVLANGIALDGADHRSMFQGLDDLTGLVEEYKGLVSSTLERRMTLKAYFASRGIDILPGRRMSGVAAFITRRARAEGHVYDTRLHLDQSRQWRHPVGVIATILEEIGIATQSAAGGKAEGSETPSATPASVASTSSPEPGPALKARATTTSAKSKTPKNSSSIQRTTDGKRVRKRYGYEYTPFISSRVKQQNVGC